MTAANPAGARWTDRLDRAETRPEVADALEGADEHLLGPLHQFLERAAERFRELRDAPRGAAFDAHAETLRQISDQLVYCAEDLRVGSSADRAAAARLRHLGVPTASAALAPAPGAARAATGPARRR